MTDGDFHFQVRCTDPACALAQPIRTIWRESAEEVGEYLIIPRQFEKLSNLLRQSFVVPFYGLGYCFGNLLASELG